MKKVISMLALFVLLLCVGGCVAGGGDGLEDALRQALPSHTLQPGTSAQASRTNAATSNAPDGPTTPQQTPAANSLYDAEYFISRGNRFNGGQFVDTPQGAYIYMDGGLYWLGGDGAQLVATHDYALSDICAWGDFIFYLASDDDGMPHSLFRVRLGETTEEMVLHNNFGGFLILHGYAYFYIWPSEITAGEPNAIYCAPLEDLMTMEPIYLLPFDGYIEHMSETDGVLYLLVTKDFEGNGVQKEYIAIDLESGEDTRLGEFVFGAYSHPVRMMAVEDMFLVENEGDEFGQYACRREDIAEEIEFSALGDIHYDGTSLYALQATHGDAALPIELALVRSDNWGKTLEALLPLSDRIPEGCLPHAEMYRAKDALYIGLRAVSQEPENIHVAARWLLCYDIATGAYDVIEELSTPPQAARTDPANEEALAIVTDMYEENGKRYVQLDYVNAVPTTSLEDDFLYMQIVNNNTKLRTFEIGEACAFGLPESIGAHGISWEIEPATYERMKECYKKIVHADPLYFHVTIQDDRVVRCDLWVEYYIAN